MSGNGATKDYLILQWRFFVFKEKEESSMCGIIGWIDWEKDLTQQELILQKMTETLANRGPDASGIWLSLRAAFGHRRLCVIDPKGGAQPMVRQREENQYVITYNGELYNTPELRAELLRRGYVFQSNSDTEVLLLSFIEWGPDCVNYLNGIFAFGIWDVKTENLFLARDRLGVKPLFFTEQSNCLLFGSELKTLLAHPSVPARIDREGLAEILMVGPARTPGHGVFQNIRELKPGHSLIYNREGLKINQYWALKSQPHQDDLKTTIRKVRELVEDAIQRQLVSDVPICTFLSGGLDSSTITSFASRFFKAKAKGKLSTYSVDFVDNNLHFTKNQFQPNSDADWIPLVSDYLATNHHNIVLDIPEQVNTLRDAVLARDLPGMTDIDTSLLLFCREVKKDATVALSGECADEIFGGYPWFKNPEAFNARTFPWTLKNQERVDILAPEIIDYVQPESYLNQRYEEALAEVPVLPGESPQDTRMREIFYLNITRFMTTLLDRKDRMSMSVGLEVRVPFCDHRIVEYVWNVPWEMKNYKDMEKGLLRTSLSDILPQEVLTRRKSPYPKTHNPGFLEATRNLILETINDPTSPLLPLIDVKKIRKLTEGKTGNFAVGWFGQLMGLPQLFAYLAQIDIWLREYKISIE